LTKKDSNDKKSSKKTKPASKKAKPASKKAKPASKKSKLSKKRSKKKSGDLDEIDIVFVDEDISIDKESELEARKAYLEEARSQEASGD